VGGAAVVVVVVGAAVVVGQVPVSSHAGSRQFSSKWPLSRRSCCTKPLLAPQACTITSVPARVMLKSAASPVCSSRVKVTSVVPLGVESR
jgi:hypothetical protein